MPEGTDLALFPNCFCPDCREMCECFGGDFIDGACANPTGTLEALIQNVGPGACKNTQYWVDFFEDHISCVGLADPDNPGPDECSAANNGDEWYTVTYEPALQEGCCFLIHGEGGDGTNFECNIRFLSVDIQYCDCGEDTYIKWHYGATGEAAADWELYGGDAVAALKILCAGGTVCPPLTAVNEGSINPGIPPEEYDPGGACEGLPAPICNFGPIGETGTLCFRFPLV